jgi:hypothetical protein
MADNLIHRIMALEETVYAVVRALEDKKVLEAGEVKNRLGRLEDSLRDTKSHEMADALRDARKRL